MPLLEWLAAGFIWLAVDVVLASVGAGVLWVATLGRARFGEPKADLRGFRRLAWRDGPHPVFPPALTTLVGLLTVIACVLLASRLAG